jgi:ribosomal-protein-alanine N-acetyltransferase
MEIGPATLDDLPGILGIEHASFPSPWSSELLKRELGRTATPQEGYESAYLAAREGNEVVGYVGMWLCWGEAHVLTLAVKPDQRRRGVGAAILEAALRHAAARGCHYATLEYRASNRAAAALYARFGFRVVGRRKGYYQDTKEDAVVVELHDLQSERVQSELAAVRREWEQKQG